MVMGVRQMAEPMVACGSSHTVFLKSDGTVWGCGYNGNGQLGLGDKTDRTTPIQLAVTDVKQVVCGYYHTIFVRNDGTVWGCGGNGIGQLGFEDAADKTTPTQLSISDVKQVACGSQHTIFLKNDSTVWGCGQNRYSQLGLGDTTARYTPTQLTITNVKQVVCGGDHTIFFKNDGTVWGCGNNNYGQLGLGNTTNRRTPVQIGTTDVTQVACGSSHTIFNKNDGTIWVCGWNQYGQLGVGDTSNRLTPTQINVTEVKQIICIGSDTFFLKNDGTVWGCGDNYYGQLGLGDTANRTTPENIGLTNVKQVVCGSSHTVFLKSDGTVWGCGYNGNGQLGLGDNNNRTTPVQLNFRFLLYKILLKDEGYYKTISDNTLLILGDQELSVANFEQNGFIDIYDIETIQVQLKSQFDVLMYDTSTFYSSITINYQSAAQLIVQTEDIDLSTYSNIKKMTMATTGSRGTIKLALSFDSGSTWKTYANGWQDIALTTDALIADGLTPVALSAITQEQWAEVKTDTLRIAYVLSKTAITDNIAVDTLTITGDTSAWERAGHMKDYDYEYPNLMTLVVHLLKDGSYKINYMEAK